MPKQSGLYKLRGTMDGVIYSNTENGHIAYQRRPINPQRFETDPKFARFRENKAEFQTAAAAGKLLRKSCPAFYSEIADKKLTRRLMSRFIKIIQSDPVSDLGKRNVAEGDLKLLEGFEFNAQAELQSIFRKPLAVTANPATGVADMSVEGFVPATSITAPPETTHYRLVMGASCPDFVNNVYEMAEDSTGFRPYDNVSTGSVGLNCTLLNTPASPMVVILGIQFSKLVNGKHYLLQDSRYNALSIVKVAS